MILGTSLESPDSVEADDEDDDILGDDDAGDDVRCGDGNGKTSSPLFVLRNHTLNVLVNQPSLVAHRIIYVFLKTF